MVALSQQNPHVWGVTPACRLAVTVAGITCMKCVVRKQLLPLPSVPPPSLELSEETHLYKDDFTGIGVGKIPPAGQMHPLPIFV